MADKLTTGLAVACVALGVGAAYLGIQLMTERDRTADAVAARENAEAKLRELESRLAQMPRRRNFEMREPSPVQSEGGTSVPERAVENYSSGIANTSPAPSQPQARGRPVAPRRNAQLMLVRSLKLNDADSEKLLAILTEEQQKLLAALSSNQGQPIDRATFEAMQAEENQRVRDLLGDDKFKELQDYRRYEPQHDQVNMLDTRLTNMTGKGLTPQQESGLFNVLKEERDRIPQPTSSQYATRPEFMTAMNQWRTDYTQRTQQRAATILTPEQLPVFANMRNFGGPPRGRQP